MNDPVYKILKIVAILFALLWLGWTIYDGVMREKIPGEKAYEAANRYFEDGNYSKALVEYEAALKEAPALLPALRGKARSLMQLGENHEALYLFNEAIKQDPNFAPAYANRGILYDRIGKYEKAIADYDKAVSLDAEKVEGPNWLTRFLRLETGNVPSVAARSQYLKEQLAKPESERVLRIPEVDAEQRPHKK
ncbi:MAG: tetratricopeptide repeat protein [Gammaproteobacteria bacterium]